MQWSLLTKAQATKPVLKVTSLLQNKDISFKEEEQAFDYFYGSTIGKSFGRIQCKIGEETF